MRRVSTSNSRFDMEFGAVKVMNRSSTRFVETIIWSVSGQHRPDDFSRSPARDRVMADVPRREGRRLSEARCGTFAPAQVCQGELQAKAKIHGATVEPAKFLRALSG